MLPGYIMYRQAASSLLGQTVWKDPGASLIGK